MDKGLRELANIITKLSSTSSRTDKESILDRNSSNIYLTELCKFMYDPMIVSGIKELKMNRKQSSDYVLDLFSMHEEHSLLDIFTYLKSNNTGKDVDIQYITEYIEDNIEYSELLKKIFTKELKLGIDITTVNKIYGNSFIKEFNVMLADNYYDNQNYLTDKEFILTTKLDGLRCIAVYENNEVKFYTRQGKPYGRLPEIESELMEYFRENYVYDGELIAETDKQMLSKDLFRETASVAMKNGNKKGLIFNVFDMIPADEFFNKSSSLECRRRKQRLHNIFTVYGRYLKHICEVEILYKGNDINQIFSNLERITDAGGEGVMINISDAPYEFKRTKNLLKVKKFRTADVKVIKINKGTGRFSNTLGSITVEFDYNNNTYACDIGSGFTDVQREKYWNAPELLINKIVEIKYFEISQDMDGKYSLRFPVWLDIIRTDKDTTSIY